jgi:hypothetical protein
LGRNLLDWVLGCAMVYGTLFGIGKLALGPRWQGVVFLVVAAGCACGLYSDLSRRWGVEPEMEASP